MSPSFVRLELVLPHGDGPVPSFEGADESWFSTWMDRPVEERGHLRTYTVRDVVGEGEETRLVVDIVLHGADDPGRAGPGAGWAARARVGDEVVVMCPRRGVAYGGIEWRPGTAERLLIVGDETAVPAIGAVLSYLADDAVGAAFLEVPLAEDVQDLVAPAGVSITWVELSDDDVDPDLWETPSFSSSGETVKAPAAAVGHDLSGSYAWIAGESTMVTGLRRVLVKELHVDRAQVAFMGYWRIGVSMAS